MAAEMAERAFEELRLRKEFGSARKQRPEQRNRREIEDAGATSAASVGASGAAGVDASREEPAVALLTAMMTRAWHPEDVLDLRLRPARRNQLRQHVLRI